MLRETFADTFGLKGHWLRVKRTHLRNDAGLAGELFDLVTTAYKPIGGHAKVRSPRDVAALTFILAADIDKDPEADAVLMGKLKPGGIKFTTLGQDGSPKAKKEVFEKWVELMRRGQAYAEVSGAVAHLALKKYKSPTIGSQKAVERVLGKKVQWVGEHPDGKYPGVKGWYRRQIGGDVHLKILVGKGGGAKSESEESGMQQYLESYRRMTGVGPSIVEAAAADPVLAVLAKAFSVKAVKPADVKYIRYRKVGHGVELEDTASRFGDILTSVEPKEADPKALIAFLKKHGAKPAPKVEAIEEATRYVVMGGQEARERHKVRAATHDRMMYAIKTSDGGKSWQVAKAFDDYDDQGMKHAYAWLDKQPGLKRMGKPHVVPYWIGEAIEESAAVLPIKTGDTKVDKAVAWLASKAKQSVLKDGTVMFLFTGKLPVGMVRSITRSKVFKGPNGHEKDAGREWVHTYSDMAAGLGFSFINGTYKTTETKVRFVAHDYRNVEQWRKEHGGKGESIGEAALTEITFDLSKLDPKKHGKPGEPYFVVQSHDTGTIRKPRRFSGPSAKKKAGDYAREIAKKVEKLNPEWAWIKITAHRDVPPRVNPQGHAFALEAKAAFYRYMGGGKWRQVTGPTKIAGLGESVRHPVVAKIADVLNMEEASEQPRWTRRVKPGAVKVRLERAPFRLDLALTEKSMDWSLYYGSAVRPLAQGFGRLDVAKLVSKVRPMIARYEESLEESQVANTILQQMGGARKLMAMTGAKHFLTTSNSVSFRFPNRLRSKPNHVEITLRPDDTYDMAFSRIVKYEAKPLKTYRGIYFDQLIELFEKQTGLYLRL